MGRTKFIIGGLLILAAVVLLIYTSTLKSAEYFMTVDELHARSTQVIDKKLRISGAVIGSTIRYDSQTLTLTFEVAHVPGNQTEIDAQGGLAAALHAAVADSKKERITVVQVGQPKPDLLRDEAQAIITGHLGADGIFHADEILLKCPTKYEEAIPEQVTGN